MGWYVKMWFTIDIPIDSGDGLNHFFIANLAPSSPLFYLDHWGKPFFTLLASLFAGAGIHGVIAMNIGLFVLTALTGISILRKLEVTDYLIALFPVLLVFTFDYSSNVLAGLTEPLFGFLALLAGFFIVRKSWFWMAIVVSFLPFCRSEGQLLILLGLIVLIFQKQWKFIPFLAVGHVIYATIGFFALDDFFWYFNDNPYPEISPYGKGTWDHFWVLRKQYLGKLGVFVVFGGVLAFSIILAFRRNRFLNQAFLFFAGATFFGILAAHVLIWAQGTHGSLGLTRVITQGVPLIFCASIYLIDRVLPDINFRIQALLVGAVLLLGASIYRKNIPEIVGSQTYEKALVEAADFVKKNTDPSQRVYYFHPVIAFALDINYHQPNKRFKTKYFKQISEDIAQLQWGDFIIRDSHFGPVEAGLVLDSLERQQELVLVKEFFPSEIHTSYHGESGNIRLYQKIPLDKQQVVSSQFSPRKLDKNSFGIDASSEFTDFITLIPNQSNQLLHVELTAKTAGGKLVCDIDNGKLWSAIGFTPNKKQRLSFKMTLNKPIKLYFWNPSGETNQVVVHSITHEIKKDHPMVKPLN